LIQVGRLYDARRAKYRNSGHNTFDGCSDNLPVRKRTASGCFSVPIVSMSSVQMRAVDALMPTLLRMTEKSKVVEEGYC